MNAELRRLADEHLQAENDRLKDLQGVLERAVVLAMAAYLDGTDPADLPGSPPADPSDRLAWLDYWIKQGALVYHEELPLTV